MAIDQEIKTVLITEIMSPYRIPVFNEIARRPKIKFTVFFLAETEPERFWRVEKEKIKFNYEVLPSFRISLPDRLPVFLNPSIASSLKKEDPDVVICGGYHHPSSFLALRYARKHRKRFLLWCESHSQSVRLNGPPFSWYRNYFMRSCDGFLVPGEKSLDFIKSFAVNGRGIWVAPNSVDNEFFSSRARPYRLRADEEKRRCGFPSKIILYVGRLIDSKGVQTLLEAVENIPSALDVGVILVGEGKDKKKYLEYCRSHRLKNVFFEGFKQQDELPLYYGVADLIVLPSFREEWGLVLNEAAAGGLPLIGTEVSGAAYDLIEDGKTGFLIPPRNSEVLKNKILQLLENARLKESMGLHAKEKADQYSPSRSAEGFLAAILAEGVKT